MIKLLLLNALFWIVFLFYLIRSIKNKTLAIEYSINWMISIILILIASSWVGLLNAVARFLRVSYPPALLIVFAFYLQIVLLLHFTKVLTKLSREKKILMQDFLISKTKFRKNSDVLIVLPAYNEEKNLAKVVNDISAQYPYDILVVDDGSADKTSDIVMALPCFHITHSYNCGYGVALETGYKYAKQNGYDYVIQFDADGQHDAESIGQLYNYLSKNKLDVVIGSRFLAKDGHYKAGVARSIGMSVFRALLRLIIKKKFSDPTSGLQIINRDVINFYTSENRFPDKFPDADMLILLHKNGFHVEEIPVMMHPNSEGKSMHSGIIKPILYMIYMTLSIIVIVIRNEGKSAHQG